jgi:hypothetical protein
VLKKRWQKLLKKNQAEGIALNKKYDELLTEVQEATKALTDFEKDKLGMHEEEVEK